MPAPEILVPFASTRAELASQLRSTLITTSLQALRARGLFDRYVTGLPAARRDEILGAIAGVWLPMELGLAHYRACDALGLSPQEQYSIGQEVGDRVQGTMLGVLVRTAKNAGMTPWSGLTQCGRLYERLFVGGAVQLAKLGPKEARMALENNPLCGISYYRNGFRGLVAAGASLFAQKTYATDVPKSATVAAFAIRVSWA